MKEEYIICSAIHWDDGNVYTHQPNNIITGIVICGRRHHNCYSILAGLKGNYEEKCKVGREGQGFLTNLNRYVNRVEGMKIAKLAGQLINPSLHEGNEDAILTSEDLY